MTPFRAKAIHLDAFVKDIRDLSAKEVLLRDKGPNDALIRVTHVSPTHVDLLYAQGLHQNNRRHAKPPFTIGSDFAGVIVSAPETSGFKQGDRVFGSVAGAFVEYIILNEAEAHGVRLVPPTWSNRQACAVGASGAISLACFASAGGVTAGSWVLITGASGGLGVMAVQIAKAMGARVIALAGEKAKASMLREIGAEICILYTEPNWEKTVIHATSGVGVDLVYDAVGMVESGLRCCRFGGKVVIVGFAGRGSNIEQVKMNRILLKGASVIGYRFGEHGRRDPQAVMEIWRRFDELVNDGKIKAVIYHRDYNSIEGIPLAMLDMQDRLVYGRSVVEFVDETSLRSRVLIEAKI